MSITEADIINNFTTETLVTLLPEKNRSEISKLSRNEILLEVFRFRGINLNQVYLDKRFIIGHKPCQSGKTGKYIIEPTINNIKNKVLTIIILPSSLSNIEQTYSRFINRYIEESDSDSEEEFEENSNCESDNTLTDDDSFVTSLETDEDIKEINKLQTRIVTKTTQITSKNIGRWDTGVSAKNRLKDADNTMEKIEKGDINIIIALQNSLGIAKLCSLLAYISLYHPTKKLHIISDEAHGFLNMNIKDNQLENNSIVEKINNDIKFYTETKKFPRHTEFRENMACNIYWILTKLNNNHFWTYSGTTATLHNITKNNAIKYLELDIGIETEDVSDKYIGYEKCAKKIYRDNNLSVIFDRVIDRRESFAIVMCHSGFKMINHNNTGYEWCKACLEAGINKKKICFITDNSLGYNIYNYKSLIVKSFKKNEVAEPWQIIKIAKENYTHIGVFGDTSMTESNTYQKCDEENDIFLTDLILLPLGVKNIKPSDTSNIIQKIGRIFGYDCREDQRDFKRTIWMFKNNEIGANDKKTLEDGFKYDSYTRNYGISNNITQLDPNIVNRKIISGLIDSNGNETNSNDYTDDDIVIQFNIYKKSNTKVAKFIKSLEVDKIYEKEQILEMLRVVGYVAPKGIINRYTHGFNTDNINFLSVTGSGKYQITENYKEIFRQVFN